MKQLVTVLLMAFLFQGRMELAAQDKLSGENVKTGDMIYEYVREQDGQKTAFGTITESIEVSGEQVKITYTQDLPRVVMTDSLVMDFKSFSPELYESFIPEMQNISVDYKKAKSVDVTIKRDIPGAEQDTSYTTNFDQVRYDSHWLPPIVYALDKENNMVWKLPVYSYNNKEDILEIKVLGEEELTLHDKTYQTVKYELFRRNSQSTYHYWIDKENQRLVQNRAEANPNLIFWMRIKSQEG